MLQLEDPIRKLTVFATVALLAAAEALAQEKAANAPRRIVVSIPDRKLAVLEGDRVVMIFRTAVGAPHSPSPRGAFRIVNQIEEPTWYTKGRIVPPGKANPLGTRWMGLSVKGYGIHGTNHPASIGHNASHGCIRMRNQDVERLFEMVSVGDEVEMYNQRTPDLDRIFSMAAVQTSAGAEAAGAQ
jgi:lipoprotein-anchoring transpeptidase ErfK/SrfK